MGFNQIEYINEYNKKTYKSYQIRIRKEEAELITYLDAKTDRNSFFVEAIKAASLKKNIYTLKQIRERITPVLHKHGINEIYLFGSYARGEATENSDVDIFCEKGSIRTLWDQQELEDELEGSLAKKVDIVFTTTSVNEYFLNEIKQDLIKLC